MGRRGIQVASIASLVGLWLVLSASTAIAAPCPNEALRSGPSAQLPDCRAYELSSPALKNGFDVLTDTPRAARSGGGFAFEAQGALPGSSSVPLLAFYLARRNPSGDGWTTKSVSPPLNPVGLPAIVRFLDWTPDLSRAIVQTAPNSPLAPDAQPGAQDLYLRDNAADSYTLISHSPATFEPRPIYGGASSDFSHRVYSDVLPETADTPAGAVNEVYERVGGERRLVGVLPNGEAVSGGVVLGSGAVGFGRRNAVSEDGSRVVFTSEPSTNAPEGQIYVRIDGTTTVEASASAKAVPDPNPTKPATYWGATSNGSAVFFSSPSALTDDANTGPADAGSDLYRFDLGSGGLVDLSPDASAGDPNGAEVQGVVGMSEDGSYVYFVAKGQLDGTKGVAGEPNLYVWHEGATRFVATLSPLDANADWKNSFELGDPPIGSRVSADGTEALITTASTQAGYDNVDPTSHEPHNEIYRYSANPTPSWACVSCNPSGTPATANATFSAPTFPIEGNQAPGYLNRALDSARGAVFFNSDEKLVPGDENNVTDAYEWQGGQLSLISSGKGQFPSYFLDADAAGENVYVATRDRLAPQDIDNLLDIYDARVGGGIAAAPAPPGCGAEPCRGPASKPAPATEPASATFAGPGDPKPPHKHRHRRHHRHHRHARGGSRG